MRGRGSCGGSTNRICCFCSTSFKSSRRHACYQCVTNHEDDLYEYIYPTDSETCSFDIFVDEQNPPFKGRKMDVIYDLHNVLDTISPTEKLCNDFTLPSCVVSYVGKATSTRLSAREEIMNRIQSGQVEFGVLVFKRSYRGSRITTEPGTKAWFISQLDTFERCIFLDDSKDHIDSVNSLRIPKLKTIYLTDHNKLKHAVNNFRHEKYM